MNDKVLVSFCSYNSPWFLEHLVSSIEHHDSGYPFDLLIWDNSSTDKQQLELLEKYSKKYRVQTRPNLGRAQGSYSDTWQQNKDYKYYFFMHDDSSILQDGWLKKAVDRIEDNSVEQCLIGSGAEELPVGKVGLECYEWGNKIQYSRTGYPQVWQSIEPLIELMKMPTPKIYQHINDDRFLIKNELLQKIKFKINGFETTIVNIENWKQIENTTTWESIHNWFVSNNLENYDPFPPNDRYGPKYHKFQTISEYFNDMVPLIYGYRTHCIEGDGFCQEELEWSKFFGNNIIAHFGSHAVFKRLAILMNTTEESVRKRYNNPTFLKYCVELIKKDVENER